MSLNPTIGDLVFLIDSGSLAYRIWYSAKSQDTGAPPLARYASILIDYCYGGIFGVRPTHAAIAFDAHGPTFRHAIYDGYKSNRTEKPDDLIAYLNECRRVPDALGVIAVEEPGWLGSGAYEADDLIATLAAKCSANGAQVVIVSSDKDFAQCTTDRVALHAPDTNAIVAFDGRSEDWRFPPHRMVFADERWGGLKPWQIAHVQALAGDSADAIPGAPGIGIKRAIDLIQQHGSIDGVFAAASDIRAPKMRETLMDAGVIAKVRMSLDLATLRTDVEMEASPGDLKLWPIAQAYRSISDWADSVNAGPLPMSRVRTLIRTMEDAA